MRHDTVIDSLAKVTVCPKCHGPTGMGTFGTPLVHVRWCLNCNLSYTVSYNTTTSKYKRSNVRKGIEWLTVSDNLRSTLVVVTEDQETLDTASEV